jgi:hypothetical protein
MKLLVSGRVHDAQLQCIAGDWVVCIGKTVMVRPEHVVRLNVRIEEATEQERGTLRAAGYSFRERPSERRPD